MFNAAFVAMLLRHVRTRRCVQALDAYQSSRCRAGKYAVSSAEYTEGNCGPKALELQKLNNALGERGQVKVEKSISIPFGTIDEVLKNHYENAGSATKLRLAKEARASNTSLQHSR